MPRGANLIGARPPGAGRQKGTPNRSTREFRQVVQQILDDNAQNLSRWISEVASGKPAQIVDPDPLTGRPGGVIPGVPPNPARAVALIAELAEYVAPKQPRENAVDNAEFRPVLNVTIPGKPVLRIEG